MDDLSPARASELLADQETLAPAAPEGEPNDRAGDERQVSLSAGPRERPLTLLLVALSTIGFGTAIPFPQFPLPKIRAFIPDYESAHGDIDFSTAILFFGQLTQLQSQALLALASGYLLHALIIVPHTPSFPGALSAANIKESGGDCVRPLIKPYRKAEWARALCGAK